MSEYERGLADALAAVETVHVITDSDMGLPTFDGVDERWIAKGNVVAAIEALHAHERQSDK